MKKLIIASLLLASCGTETSTIDIVGGSPVYRRYYGRFEVGGGFRCGSSLIAPRFMITAKHCIPEVHKDKIKVRIGAYDISREDNGGKPYELIPVVKVYEHPKFDLALLKLSRASKFKPVEFGNDHPPLGINLHAFGFGNTSWKGKGSTKLLGVTLKHLTIKNPAPHIIYAGLKVGSDICHGDSGGPLINPENGRLIGVTRFTGSQCGTMDSGKRPSGWTRPDMAWIEGIVK